MSTKKFKVKFCYWNKLCQWYEDDDGNKYVRIGGKSALSAIELKFGIHTGGNVYIGKHCNVAGVFEVYHRDNLSMYTVQRIIEGQDSGRDNRIILVRVY